MCKKFFALIYFFIVSCANIWAQETIDIVKKYCLEKDIEILERYVWEKVKERESCLGGIGGLKQVHVFKMNRSNPFYKLKKQDWTDYSFFEHITPKYVKVKVHGKKMRLLDAYTYLVDKKNNFRHAVCITGHTPLYSCASEMPEELLCEDNCFILFSSFDAQFERVRKDNYIVVRNNKLYGFTDWQENNTLIPWEDFLKEIEW